jgi:hypothetical protein
MTAAQFAPEPDDTGTAVTVYVRSPFPRVEDEHKLYFHRDDDDDGSWHPWRIDRPSQMCGFVTIRLEAVNPPPRGPRGAIYIDLNGADAIRLAQQLLVRAAEQIGNHFEFETLILNNHKAIRAGQVSVTMRCRCGFEMQWVGGVAEWHCPHCSTGAGGGGELPISFGTSEQFPAPHGTAEGGDDTDDEEDVFASTSASDDNRRGTERD